MIPVRGRLFGRLVTLGTQHWRLKAEKSRRSRQGRSSLAFGRRPQRLISTMEDSHAFQRL
jgi:hypothetical protein